MRIYPFIALPFIFLLAIGQITYAQNRPNQGIGDIIGDIFKGNQGGQAQYPNQTMIDNIPVNVRFDTVPNGLPENAILIISAFAPPAPNVRRKFPLLIGETRLLLTGLKSPLELVIAAPAALTQEIDYARIEAKIVNPDGEIIFKSREQGEYRGRDIPVITLEPTDLYVPTQTPQIPISPTSETVSGIINLNNSSKKFRGANLIVHLIEEGLAGGKDPIVLGASKQSIDQKTGPFAFSFEKSQAKNPKTPLVFDAWIQDWAGRKTHTLPYPMQYNGPDLSYRLKLKPVN
ncbi:MAG: hypothetical protein JKX72_02905, partial [Robiginitomaculum sp.]|nr:hypothetical protein [Robiginitomaculum sp.]